MTCGIHCPPSGARRLRKLFINAEPGAILAGRPRELCRTFPDQTEVTVRGSHFIREDSPGQIGRALARWIAKGRNERR